MAISDIKRITIISHISEKERLLSELQRAGVVDISQAGEDEYPEDLSPGIAKVPLDGDEIGYIEEKLSRIHYSLDFFDKFHKVPKSFIEQFAGTKVGLTGEEFAKLSSDIGIVEEIYGRSRGIDEGLNDLANRRGRIESEIAEYTPFVALDAKLSELEPTRFFDLIPGSIDGQPEPLLEEIVGLEGAEGDVYVEVIDKDKQSSRILVYIKRATRDEILPVFAKYGFSELSLPEVGESTISEYIEDLKKELAEIGQREEELRKKALELVEYRLTLFVLYDHLSIKLERLMVNERFLRTGRTVIIEGWIKEKSIDGLEKRIRDLSLDAIFDIRDPLPEESVPVELENSRLLSPFELILNLFSLPSRDELDPTPFLAGFFTLFFAMSFTDAGYGIALAVICFFLLKRVRMEPAGRKLFQLLLISGLVTIPIGALFGGWFGDLPDWMEKLTGIRISTQFKPIWFNPVEDPIKFLILSFAVGIVQIYTGLALKFYDNIKRGMAVHGIFDQGFWMIAITGLVMMAIGTAYEPLSKTGQWVAVAGAVGLVLTQGRNQKNILLKIGSGLVSLYNITGYFGDLLSYSRLLGLGMASGIVASVINLLADMVVGTPYIGWLLWLLVVVGGHTFNLMMGVLSGYVHSSRLQYVEFLGKFFEGGGRAFKPFDIKTKYTYLKSHE